MAPPLTTPRNWLGTGDRGAAQIDRVDELLDGRPVACGHAAEREIAGGVHQRRESWCRRGADPPAGRCRP